MIDYRPIIVSSLVLNAIVINNLIAYSGSDNFFKFVTIIIDLFVIAVVIFDLVYNLFNKNKRWKMIKWVKYIYEERNYELKSFCRW